jgi:pimeloyl-ACP methyl ester carboxylesterase
LFGETTLRRLFPFGALLLLISGCTTTPKYRGLVADGTHARGTIERVEYLKSYSAIKLRMMVLLARLPEHLPVENGVDLYRVSYWTENLGHPELASGLYANPRGLVPRATVTWLNGTNPTRSEAPSSANLTGVLVSAAYAGSGFLLLAPDYIGLGVSQTYHPYLNATATANASIDFIRAARTVSSGLGIPWQSRMLLVGYSQGGFSTAVVQRALEATPEPGVDVRAAAALAPPFNLSEVSVPFAFEGKSTADSFYLAYLANSYALVYGQPLDTLLNEQFARSVPTLFDGTHSVDEITAQLPRNPRDMFRREAVAAFTNGQPSWFRQALHENEAFQWAPKAPLRLYYGERDVDVPPIDPKQAAEAMRALAGNVELVPLGPYDHEGVVYHGVPRVQAWFVELTR